MFIVLWVDSWTNLWDWFTNQSGWFIPELLWNRIICQKSYPLIFTSQWIITFLTLVIGLIVFDLMHVIAKKNICCNISSKYNNLTLKWLIMKIKWCANSISCIFFRVRMGSAACLCKKIRVCLSEWQWCYRCWPSIKHLS